MTRIPFSILMFALLTVGCGGPQRATVEGIVTLDGKPLADVEVQFIPEPEQQQSATPASAYTDESGRYRIESGVCVGPNRVCVNDARLMMPGGGIDPDDGTPGADRKSSPRRSRVPEIYSDATRTPHRAINIQSGVQTLNFTLKSKP
jgi:hypothetical protein